MATEKSTLILKFGLQGTGAKVKVSNKIPLQDVLSVLKQKAVEKFDINPSQPFKIVVVPKGFSKGTLRDKIAEKFTLTKSFTLECYDGQCEDWREVYPEDEDEDFELLQFDLGLAIIIQEKAKHKPTQSGTVSPDGDQQPTQPGTASPDGDQQPTQPGTTSTDGDQQPTQPGTISTDDDQQPTQPGTISTDGDQQPTQSGTTSTDGDQNPGKSGTAGDQEPEKYPLCSSAPDIEQKGGTSGTPQRAAAASVSKRKVWKGRQSLKVYFMNPDDIMDPDSNDKKDPDDKKDPNEPPWGWRCRGEPMNINTILAWARVWNFSGFPVIPVFENYQLADKADIRVKFSDSGQNWSVVGMEATDVKDLKKPTMMLSLGGHTPDLQESLVVHEFGHALGLEHEHQRSDFWKVLGKHLDTDKMKKDRRVNPTKDPEKGEELFKKNWGEIDGGKSKSSPYDPESIMHYWFDIKWIRKVTLQSYEEIDKDPELKCDPDAKRYLKGIHERSKKGELTKRPSLKDYKALVEAYGGDFEESEELMQALTAPDRMKGGAILRVNTHLRTIRNVVWEMRVDWRRLGLELEISPGTLDAINVDRQNAGDKLGSVLEKWMYTGKATTNDLVNALRAATVGRFDLADKVSSVLIGKS